MRDHYVARIFDLLDLGRAALRAGVGVDGNAGARMGGAGPASWETTMATSLETRVRYADDLHAWSLEQAALLRARRTEGLDWDHLAESSRRWSDATGGN